VGSSVGALQRVWPSDHDGRQGIPWNCGIGRQGPC
jgi:hypothetical protein